MQNVTVSLQLAPQYGDMAPMRDAWIEAEALGVDRLYTCDHFNAMVISQDVLHGDHAQVSKEKNFEATTIQAAMAATTMRPEIGCIVHAVGYRNPNLMADIARTIDHISGGRFILGMGAGYLQPDYDEYGYEYGTQAGRLQDLSRALPVIKDRFAKLNPPPLRRIPLLIASSGEKIGLRIVAEHADIWHVYGSRDFMQHKKEVLERYCAEIGRDPAEIQCATQYMPGDSMVARCRPRRVREDGHHPPQRRHLRSPLGSRRAARTAAVEEVARELQRARRKLSKMTVAFANGRHQ